MTGVPSLGIRHVDERGGCWPRRGSWKVIFFFFFFQAEDGIRDWSVTGVQTCALPIWCSLRQRLRFLYLPILAAAAPPLFLLPISRCGSTPLFILPGSRCGSAPAFYTARFSLRQCPWFLYRSEERRVGKGGRSRWLPYH